MDFNGKFKEKKKQRSLGLFHSGNGAISIESERRSEDFSLFLEIHDLFPLLDPICFNGDFYLSFSLFFFSRVCGIF